MKIGIDPYPYLARMLSRKLPVQLFKTPNLTILCNDPFVWMFVPWLQVPSPILAGDICPVKRMWFQFVSTYDPFLQLSRYSCRSQIISNPPFSLDHPSQISLFLKSSPKEKGRFENGIGLSHNGANLMGIDPKKHHEFHHSQHGLAKNRPKIATFSTREISPKLAPQGLGSPTGPRPPCPGRWPVDRVAHPAWAYPLVNQKFAIENGHWWWIYLVKMVMFHSYVWFSLEYPRFDA